MEREFRCPKTRSIWRDAVRSEKGDPRPVNVSACVCAISSSFFVRVCLFCARMVQPVCVHVLLVQRLGTTESFLFLLMRACRCLVQPHVSSLYLGIPSEISIQ